jgi:hypothetical protein
MLPMRRDIKTEARRLLCLLQLWFSSLSTDSSERRM